MPSVELSKLGGVSAPRALAVGDRAQIEARARPAAAPTAVPALGNAPGVSLEVAGPSDVAAAPVDAERVAEIRAALQDGSYPLVPTKIVDAMIAAQVSLSLPERT
jgi:negative regulator of flagellin synthesis FlgM